MPRQSRHRLLRPNAGTHCMIIAPSSLPHTFHNNKTFQCSAHPLIGWNVSASSGLFQHTLNIRRVAYDHRSNDRENVCSWWTIDYQPYHSSLSSTLIPHKNPDLPTSICSIHRQDECRRGGFRHTKYSDCCRAEPWSGCCMCTMLCISSRNQCS